MKNTLIIIFLALFITACDEEDSETPAISDGLALFGNDSNIATIDIEVDNTDCDNHDYSVISGFEIWENGENYYTYRQIGSNIDGQISVSDDESIYFIVHYLDCSDLDGSAECGTNTECVWNEAHYACYDIGSDDSGGVLDCSDLHGSAECGTNTECVWSEVHYACYDICGNEYGANDSFGQNGTPIVITGINAGVTSFRIQLANYISLPINVTVTESSLAKAK